MLTSVPYAPVLKCHVLKMHFQTKPSNPFLEAAQIKNAPPLKSLADAQSKSGIRSKGDNFNMVVCESEGKLPPGLRMRVMEAFHFKQDDVKKRANLEVDTLLNPKFLRDV